MRISFVLLIMICGCGQMPEHGRNQWIAEDLYEDLREQGYLSETALNQRVQTERLIQNRLSQPLQE